MQEAPFQTPFSLSQQWLADAESSEVNDPTAMSLATANVDGLPSLRMVLLKGCDERGFVFFTKFEIRNGADML